MELFKELLERRGNPFSPQKIAGAKEAGVDLKVFFGDKNLTQSAIDYGKKRNKFSGAKVITK